MKNEKIIFYKIIITSILLLAIVNNGFSTENVRVEEILKHADRARGNIGGVEWDVSISSVEDGSVTSRKIRVKVKGDNVLARFIAPAKLKNQIILMRDRNMWFIKPGLSKPVSISPRQKLIGRASNGDIASTNYVKDYEAKMIGEEKINAEDCYILDLKAANKNVTYDRIKYWISKKRFLGVKAEYYTVSGKLFKSADFKYKNRLKLDNKESIPFVSELVIKDAIQENFVTTMTYTNIETKTIPSSAFNINLLIR